MPSEMPWASCFPAIRPRVATPASARPMGPAAVPIRMSADDPANPPAKLLAASVPTPAGRAGRTLQTPGDGLLPGLTGPLGGVLVLVVGRGGLP